MFDSNKMACMWAVQAITCSFTSTSTYMAVLRAMGALAVQGCRPAPSFGSAPSLGHVQKQMKNHKQRSTAQMLRAASTAAAASAGGAPPASRAPAQRPAADSGSAEARPLPRVVLKGGKSKLFTGDAPSPMVRLICHRHVPLLPCMPIRACMLCRCSSSDAPALLLLHWAVPATLFTDLLRPSPGPHPAGVLGGGGPCGGAPRPQGRRCRAGVRWSREGHRLGRVQPRQHVPCQVSGTARCRHAARILWLWGQVGAGHWVQARSHSWEGIPRRGIRCRPDITPARIACVNILFPISSPSP